MHTTIRGQLFPTPSHHAILQQLMRHQSSAMRTAYVQLCQQTPKPHIETLLKQRYHALNSRYARDGYTRAYTAYRAACEQVAQGRLTPPSKLVFGSRKTLSKRRTHHISHADWQQRRRNQLYSRGERAKHGNLNLRLLHQNNQLILRVNTGPHTWIRIPAHLPRLPDDILHGTIAYSIRILHDPTGYRVHVGYESTYAPQVDFSRGAVGVDFNHNTIDLTVTNRQGNLRATQTLSCHILTEARRAKRIHHIGNLAKQVVAYARYWQRGLVLEDLRDVARGKWNQHMFTHRRFLEVVVRRATRQGVMVRWVNPAYTSVIGAWKYAPYYHVTVHQAAALVIARRGQGLSEPLRRLKTLVVNPMEGRDTSESALNRRVHAWSLWQRIKALPLHNGAHRMRLDQAHSPLVGLGREVGDHAAHHGTPPDGGGRREIVIPGCGPPHRGVKEPHSSI